VAGVAGRDSGEVRLEVLATACAAALEGLIEGACPEGATLHTDEWNGYNRRGRRRRWTHRAVDHSGPKSTWAVDEDGDGVREVHCDTMEGLWAGLRTFLRPFRGVSKWYLHQYVGIFQWGANIKAVSDEFWRCLLRVPLSTCFAT
jgi:transposase